MNSFVQTIRQLYQQFLQVLQSVNWLGPLALRFYLAPIFIIAGYNKLNLSDDSLSFIARLGPNSGVVSWFGNPDWGLGLPAPELLAFMAGWTELIGGFLLVFGLLTRLISIPLIFTMIIAATTAHWGNGWFAIAPSNPASSAAQPLAWIGIDAAEESLDNSNEVNRRLSAMKSLLNRHGNPDWLFEKGSIVVLNNGIEFAVTYLFMLLMLLFHGGGRWVSLDHWLFRTR